MIRIGPEFYTTDHRLVMAERDLIEFISGLDQRERASWLSVPIGDDAAEISLPGGGRIIVSTDMLIEGVHFEAGVGPELVGRKAVCRAHSDTAAMAARPLATIVAAAFGPGWPEDRRRTFCRALHESCQELDAPLIGGDISSTTGPAMFTVTALGTPGPSGSITRSGARPGDAICVTGALGGSLRSHHLDFFPRIDEALELAARCDLHALIDLSDGLSTDVLHLADESGVGVHIEAGRVPVSADARRTAREAGRDPVWHALNDGEDYELLFCINPAEAEDLESTGVLDVPVTRVGTVVEPEEGRVLVAADGSTQELESEGWEHLKANG